MLQAKGNDIYRMKGVLSIATADQKYVYQGVHMVFDGDFMEPWEKDEKRVSEMVFIGKDLDHALLKRGFELCIAPPDFIEKKRAALRFAIGTKVECKTGTGKNAWSAGEVVNQMYQDETMPPGQIAPYQVKL